MKYKFLVVFSSLLLSSLSYANPSGENIFYLGAGKSVNGEFGDKGKGAGTIGFLKLNSSSGALFGGDIGIEGTSYHNGTPESGASLNLLIGRNFSRTDTGRFDGAFLIGVEEKKPLAQNLTWGIGAMQTQTLIRVMRSILGLPFFILNSHLQQEFVLQGKAGR
ncbi:MAG: hypothetical protein EBT07_11535 [Actinobacteria bacterium]|nr:hypothetical protein [Actinomycetota bacterium]